MENKYFLNYLKDNLSRISSSLEKIFSINFDEFSLLIKTIIQDINVDDFYSKTLIYEGKISNFDEPQLLEIKKLFIHLGLSDLEIKKIIVTIPEILLFSNRIEDIYPIYKNNTFKGIVLINENDYRAYSYSESSYKLASLNNLANNKINDYRYLVENLLNSLKREDIKQQLGFEITEDTKLNDIFLALTKDYSRKNYYFKKK